MSPLAVPRVAVVTGGCSGIGAATVTALAADGFRVAVLDLVPDTVLDTVPDTAPSSVPSSVMGPADPAPSAAELTIRADVADAGQVDRATSQILDSLGRIDVLVNNAGITGSSAATTCHETPVAEWDRVVAVNVRGPFLCSRAVLPVMLAQGAGHVITVASSAGLVAFPGRCAYTASKGGALMLAKSIAVDYAGRGIRSNAVCPGFVQTPMTQWRLDVPALREQVEARIPVGRVAAPADIADAISVLASGRMAYMTGHALLVDGGWTAL